MTLQPPSGPEPQDSAIKAHALADELLSLSQEILTLCQGDQPELPALNQRVIRRSRLLQEIEQIDLTALSAESQQALEAKLGECRSLDGVIEKQFYAYRAELEEQLRSLKDSRSLMDKYRAGERETSTHQEDA